LVIQIDNYSSSSSSSSSSLGSSVHQLGSYGRLTIVLIRALGVGILVLVILIVVVSGHSGSLDGFLLTVS
jgi:hypothetical protein